MPQASLIDIFGQDVSTTGEHRKGELVIAGSGLASVRQLTIEGLQYIRRANTVFYLVSDPTTEAFVQENAKHHVDLYQFYDENKPRIQSYVQMAEVWFYFLC